MATSLELSKDLKERLDRIQDLHPSLRALIEGRDTDALSERYDGMIRHTDESVIRASGKLHDDDFCALRQIMYRRLAHLKDGVIMPVDSSELMHHPV